MAVTVKPAVKSPPGWTVRVFALAQRSEIGVGGRHRAKGFIESDRAVDPRARFDEGTALTGITTEVELDGRLLWMQTLRIAENLFGLG